MLNRDISFLPTKLSMNVMNNNSNILKYLNFELKLPERKINDTLLKIKEFVNELDVKEATGYLIGIFEEFVA